MQIRTRLLSGSVMLLMAASLLSACSKNASSETSEATAAPAMVESGTAMVAGNPAHGKQIFTQNCAQCHGASGVEGGVGPSLKSEKSKKDTAATIAWIKNPQAPMPKLYPSPLNEKDVADVAAYVESL